MSLSKELSLTITAPPNKIIIYVNLLWLGSYEDKLFRGFSLSCISCYSSQTSELDLTHLCHSFWEAAKVLRRLYILVRFIKSAVTYVVIAHYKRDQGFTVQLVFCFLFFFFSTYLCFYLFQIKCIDEVERRGLSEVGIYRVPG